MFSEALCVFVPLLNGILIWGNTWLQQKLFPLISAFSIFLAEEVAQPFPTTGHCLLLSIVAAPLTSREMLWYCSKSLFLTASLMFLPRNLMCLCRESRAEDRRGVFSAFSKLAEIICCLRDVLTLFLYSITFCDCPLHI